MSLIKNQEKIHDIVMMKNMHGVQNMEVIQSQHTRQFCLIW